jgi:hypothetical protein
MHRLSPCLDRLEDRTDPATIPVTSLADAGPGSLRAALAQADALPGKDTIVFKLPAPPANSENIITLTSGELTSKGNVTITGPGAGKLIVSGNGASRVFDINDGSAATDSPATITGLSIVSGHVSGPGGGILSYESPALTGVVLSGNYADSGAGLFVGDFRSVTISKSQVVGNTAAQFGGGLSLPGLHAIKISKSIISGNAAESLAGGGVYASLASTGTGMSITGCAVTGNTASYGGGMCLKDFSTVTTAKATVSGCTVSGNTSTSTGSQGGGGLYLTRGTFAVTGCTVSDNTAVYYGGGVEANNFASITISRSTVAGNQTTQTNATDQGGGGLFIQGSGAAPLNPAAISGCTISSNSSAHFGGGALVTGGVRLTVTGSRFAGDRAAVAGGGLTAFGAAAKQVATSITGCTFANEKAGSGGGLLFFGDGPVTMTATKVTGCTALGGGAGGGLYVKCYAAADGFVMTGCIVSGNTAILGGGIAISLTPDFHISNSSMTNNWATSDGGGAFIRLSGGSILGTTITGNAATFGGGVAHSGSETVALQIAKVHGNTAPTDPDVEGTFTFV